jgi:hypothetical protein
MVFFSGYVLSMSLKNNILMNINWILFVVDSIWDWSLVSVHYPFYLHEKKKREENAGDISSL